MNRNVFDLTKPALSILLILTVLVMSSCAYVRTSDDTSAQTEIAASDSGTVQDATETQSVTEQPTAVETEPTEAPTEAARGSARSDPDDIYDASGFVSVSDVIPDVILEIRYYSTYNFVGERIDGYEEPIALLSKEAADALKNAADELREKGYRIKIFDAYRPQRAVDHFARWASDTSDTRMKEYFYPEVDKSLLFSSGYIAYRSGHSRGCTVDITLFDMKTGKEVDMGGPFDYFGQLSHPDYSGVTDQQYQNRMLLRGAMTDNGFRPCSTEWWDFTLINEPYPYTYFSFPVSSESLKTN